jgi:hypothetical protein
MQCTCNAGAGIPTLELRDPDRVAPVAWAGSAHGRGMAVRQAASTLQFELRVLQCYKLS